MPEARSNEYADMVESLGVLDGVGVFEQAGSVCLREPPEGRASRGKKARGGALRTFTLVAILDSRDGRSPMDFTEHTGGQALAPRRIARRYPDDPRMVPTLEDIRRRQGGRAEARPAPSSRHAYPEITTALANV